MNGSRLRALCLLSALAPALAYACGGPEADVLRRAANTDAADATSGALDAATIDANVSPQTDAMPALDAALAVDACAGKDLTNDPEHCGACFHSCLGGPCTDGVCGPALVANLFGPIGIAVDGERVYIADGITDGGVYSVRKDGSDRKLIAPNQDRTQHVTLAEPYVLWSTVQSGVVGRVAKDGAGLQILARTGSSPGEIVVDDNDIYFVDVYLGAIRRMPRDGWDGGLPPAFVSGVTYGWGLANAGTDVVWSSRGTFVYNDAGIGGFFASDGILYARPKDESAAPRVLVTGQQDPLSLTADATGIYWVNGNGWEIRKLAPGATSSIVLASNQMAPWGITLDATDVYFTCRGNEDGTGFVGRVSKNGGPVTVIARNLSFPTTIAVDDVAVYWTNTHGATVMRVAK